MHCRRVSNSRPITCIFGRTHFCPRTGNDPCWDSRGALYYFMIQCTSRRLSIHVVKPRLNRTRIVLSFLSSILLQNDGPHQPPRSTTTSEELKLRKSLLWKDIQTVQGDPATVGKGTDLLHQRGVQRFVSQLCHVSTMNTESQTDGYLHRRRRHPWDFPTIELVSQSSVLVHSQCCAPGYQSR